MLLNVCGTFKIKRIAKKQRLHFRVNFQFLIMSNHCFTPFNWIATIMTKTTIKRSISFIEVHQKCFTPNYISKINAIFYTIFLSPNFHKTLIHISRIELRVSHHTHRHFMSRRANCLYTVFFSKIDV